MNGVNQKCNAFQAIIGIYLKSCNTPERVVDCLSRMGLSISQDSVYNAVDSLSREATETLQTMGRSLIVGYNYDNLDFNFAHATSTIENAGDTLAHFTAGFMFYLDHGASPRIFECSEHLYRYSQYNPNRIVTPVVQHPFITISNIHEESPHPSGLSRRQRFDAWVFLSTLIEFGPEYFRKFRGVFSAPESVEKIPVVKLRCAPCRTMNISEASVSGNINVVGDLLRQAGVGDPGDNDRSASDADLVDITRHILLFHGDLGTYERVQSILKHRSIEKTPYRRFQFMFFVFGLFHLKMAAADAIWRIFLKDKSSHGDPTSLMHLVSIMRPNDSLKIGSNPRFRQMHEVITRIGAVFRLDAWREAAARRNPQWTTLELFATAQPSAALLQEIAYELVRAHVPTGENTFDLHIQPSQSRDQAYGNTAQLHRYFLLYEELSYGMNHGDIGRVESVYPEWILLFKATGKHKYASAMTESLSTLYADYFPADLRRIIRYNMLVNPAGKAGKFRALDWVQEEKNLHTKIIHGGSNSNYTQEHVIKESVLIDLYRSCHEDMDQNFNLTSLTTAHAPANLDISMRVASDSLKTSRPHDRQPGRRSNFHIPDMLDLGMAKLWEPIVDAEDRTMEDGLNCTTIDSDDIAVH
ncbi:hypothetical protein K523DRAFT_288205 [Schizophyllum commune Tattone D]|nr:hypothetical protein K523DRAFT_288205 [Schizophyllum commune Tattone D]